MDCTIGDFVTVIFHNSNTNINIIYLKKYRSETAVPKFLLLWKYVIVNIF